MIYAFHARPERALFKRAAELAPKWPMDVLGRREAVDPNYNDPASGRPFRAVPTPPSRKRRVLSPCFLEQSAKDT